MKNVSNRIILLVIILIVVVVAIVAVTSNRSVSDHPADILKSSQNATSTVLDNSTSQIVPGGRVRSAEEKTLNMGETKEIAGVKVTLNRLVQEYRCVEGDQCPENGGVAVNVTFDNGNKKETRNFASDEAPYQFEGYTISITNIAPIRSTSKTIKESEYQITFKVEPVAGRNPASNI